jgi:hypothetical protein
MKINDAALIEDGDINDDIRIPTGEDGDLAISLGQIKQQANTLINPNNLKTVILDIGDWNMDTTTNVLVPHGIEDLISKKHWIDVTILGDVEIQADPTSLYAGGYPAIANVFNDKINLVRTTGGAFDNTSYNATSYNRGWIKITYIDA